MLVAVLRRCCDATNAKWDKKVMRAAFAVNAIVNSTNAISAVSITMSQQPQPPLLTFGTLTTFDQGAESWTNNTEQLEASFEANVIVHSKRKQSILLTSVGARMCARLQSSRAQNATGGILQENTQVLNTTPLPRALRDLRNIPLPDTSPRTK